MTLYINTASNQETIIGLKKNDSFVVKNKFNSYQKQSEKLLVEIDKMLQRQKITLKKIKEIEAETRGDSFTALRIGILTANALAYALSVPIRATIGETTAQGKIRVVIPEYGSEPNIGKKK
jgi:tRNA A37 threonylcarbamoyladenosine modification protein TsaB